MQDFDPANLIYLIALLGALMSWFILQGRRNLNRHLQYLAIWGLIFMGVLAVAGLWGDIRQTVQPRQAVFADAGRIELPRAPDGHYYATLDLNGTPVRFVVDTGASSIVLTREDAAKAGLDQEDLMFLSQAMTANGAVRTAPVTLDSVALGPFQDSGVAAFVNDGEMQNSLLGMTYLQRYSRLEIANGKLILER